MIKSFFVLISIVFLAACSEIIDQKASLDDSEYQLITHNNEFNLMIPKFMDATTSLNDEAVIQYQNIFKETYLIIIDENIEEVTDAFYEAGIYDPNYSFMENYVDFQIESISTDANSAIKGDHTKSTINGLEAETIDLTAQIEGVAYEIYYKVCFLKSEEKIYYMMLWTLNDRRDNYKEAFQKIYESFSLGASQPKRKVSRPTK